MTDERRFLTMDDGVRIAVTLHFPDHVPPPWPVVFEARPYRKDDVSDATPIYRRLCDEGGLAVCRSDVRGTGSSEGVAVDEYTEREWRDHVATIAWLAEQDWSNGSVGMFGTSYSGFNSLQVAALAPPALKAIIPIYATDRRYTDDVHFGGGVRRGIDFLDYPLMMVAMNALPPAPAVFGEGWREEWLRRIDANEPWELNWLEQQDEPYWRHGSVFFEGYERIRAATLVIAGHADGYRNMALRALERITGAPVQVLFGPWSHMSPRLSMPGPRIDHVPLMIRWWRRWLAGEPNGAERDPALRIFVREPSPPRADLDAFEGRWRADAAWPPAGSAPRMLGLAEAHARNGTDLAVEGDVGASGSIWCAADLPFGIAWDQREDEARSLVFEWGLDGPLEIVGHPRVDLTLTSSAEVAFVSAKLCCVHADGASELITRAILNLTHRDGHDAVAPLVPGEPVRVAFDLDATAFAFPAGARVRLDLAGSDFPSSWPPPRNGRLTVDPAGSRLELPAVGPAALPAPVFEPGAAQAHRPERVTWEVRDDVIARTRAVAIDHGGDRAAGRGMQDAYRGEIVVPRDDPGRTRASGEVMFQLDWPEALVRTESRGTLRTDPDTWRLELELDVYEGGELLRSRRWDRAVPRRLQ
ncbi:MAG: CocE/NonD family hydrolase [Planctomycetaceae bacterium]